MLNETYAEKMSLVNECTNAKRICQFPVVSVCVNAGKAAVPEMEDLVDLRNIAVGSVHVHPVLVFLLETGIPILLLVVEGTIT